jgi:hypothetical protein
VWMALPLPWALLEHPEVLVDFFPNSAVPGSSDSRTQLLRPAQANDLMGHPARQAVLEDLKGCLLHR